MKIMRPEEIKQIRKQLGLTSKQLAKKIGVGWNTVRSWECGARRARGAVVTLLKRLVEEEPARSR